MSSQKDESYSDDGVSLYFLIEASANLIGEEKDSICSYFWFTDFFKESTNYGLAFFPTELFWTTFRF